MPYPVLLQNISCSYCFRSQSWAHTYTWWLIVPLASTASDFHATATLKITNNPVVSWSVSWWKICIHLHYMPCTVLMVPAPNSWSVFNSHRQPLSENLGLWCWCLSRNWSCFREAISTSTWEIKQKIIISLGNTCGHKLLYGGRYVNRYAKVYLCHYRN